MQHTHSHRDVPVSRGQRKAREGARAYKRRDSAEHGVKINSSKSTTGSTNSSKGRTDQVHPSAKNLPRDGFRLHSSSPIEFRLATGACNYVPVSLAAWIPLFSGSLFRFWCLGEVHIKVPKDYRSESEWGDQLNKN